jgi:hypothetical protein
MKLRTFPWGVRVGNPSPFGEQSFRSDLRAGAHRCLRHSCAELDLAESRYAAANELVATKVIEIAQTGERDLTAIVQRALKELRHS